MGTNVLQHRVKNMISLNVPMDGNMKEKKKKSAVKGSFIMGAHSARKRTAEKVISREARDLLINHQEKSEARPE